MKKNVGVLDSYLRLTVGFFLLGHGIRKSSCISMLLGSMKIAEGITRWCPMLHLLNLSTIEKTGNDTEIEDTKAEKINADEKVEPTEA